MEIFVLPFLPLGVFLEVAIESALANGAAEDLLLIKIFQNSGKRFG